LQAVPLRGIDDAGVSSQGYFKPVGSYSGVTKLNPSSFPSLLV